MTRSKWHVPTQVFGSCLALSGYFLGHMHRGREFNGTNVHARFANILQILLLTQVTVGVYLKCHWERGINKSIRMLVRPIHSINGKAMVVFSWTQFVFGGITTVGICQGVHLGQCLNHFILGNAFAAYAIMLMIVFVVGQSWLRRSRRPQEFFECCAISAWGCLQIFTQHRWGTTWAKSDWQYTVMGIFWWVAGLTGIWLSRDQDGHPRRNLIPAIVIFITGWASALFYREHGQERSVSAVTHSTFGYTLMAAGMTRILEVTLTVKDQQRLSNKYDSCSNLQNLYVFVSIVRPVAQALVLTGQLLLAAGFLLMGATEEQTALVDKSTMDAASYILILYSLSLVVFLSSNVLIHLYRRLSGPPPDYNHISNGHARPCRAAGDSRLRTAEDAELDGLGDDEEHKCGRL